MPGGRTSTSTTSKLISGRSKEPLTVVGERSWSFATSSARTSGVAVAVSAMNGTRGSAARRVGPSRKYEGRKSWPHVATQCASSTATSLRSPRRASAVSTESSLALTADSGEQ